MKFSVWSPEGIGEVMPGDSLADLILNYCPHLENGDIVCVTSKIVSKAEGRLVDAHDREDAITQETVRIVAQRSRPNGPPLRIVENKLGLVMAAAGVDASNVPAGKVLLLPENPDETARSIRSSIYERTGRNIAVLISDSAGRPWRDGLTEIAIGCAGILPLEDYRGQQDTFGQQLTVTATALADELVCAAELVKGKTSGRPLAVITGKAECVLPITVDGPGARSLVRLGENDLFSMGTAEATEYGQRMGNLPKSFIKKTT
ncbi:coenzyme F420-0:L-glutamate ligase [Timonella sp. A28]|uniref:coenzyme F420-0:L-glutamate ligase n=1 Tax=Timonella sp. A28 TaxID=3442640 RepID=UPI003EB877B1